MYIRVDLSDYEDEVFEYAEDNGYVSPDDVICKEDLQEIIDELEKEIYIYTTKSDITLEDVVNRLKELL